MNVRPFLGALALLAGGCHGGGAAPDQAPLAGAKLGGPFALTDQDGRAVTDASYAGKYRAIYFGYTFCPDVCPTTLQKLMAGYHAFAGSDAARAAKLVPIFVTVDPERDTPVVMKAYVGAFGAELQGLTGTPQQIAQVARAYGVYYKAQPVEKGAGGYLVDHSSQAVLFGPDGTPIALLPTDQGPEAVASTLAQWVR